MINISTNISDLILLNSLNNSTNGLNKSIERLTTGFKLNHASDNAAGINIVNNLNTKISSLLQIRNNTEDGVSLLSTAQGVLETIQGELEKLRGLAIQASNETYGSASLASLQAEADSIISSINQIRDTAEFNGIKLFSTTVYDEHASNAAPVSPISTLSLPETEAPAQPAAPRRAARVMAAPLAETGDSELIEGSVKIDAGATKTITIDGVNYTVKNRNATATTISYNKDTATNKLTFLGSYFDITCQSDVSHNISIAGSYNYIYGGDLDDTFNIEVDTYHGNKIYGRAGNDTFNCMSWDNTFFGEDGDDTFNLGYALAAYGGDGNDTFYLRDTSNKIEGNAGNDTFYVYTNGNSVNGNDGDDNFVVSGSNNTLNGGAGNNTITNTGSNNILVNLPGAEWSTVDFRNGETKVLTIDNKEYSVKAKKNSTLMWKVDSDGKISFKSDNSYAFDITAQKDKSHNVYLSAWLGIFHGGDLDDTITSGDYNTVYGNGGNDTITLDGYDVFAYGGDGDDTITLTNRAYICRADGGDGNDTIITNKASVNMLIGGAGDDTITTYRNDKAIVDGGEGNNTIVNNSSLAIVADSDEYTKSIRIGAGATVNVTINGVQYSVENKTAEENSFVYGYNPATGEISMGGFSFNISTTSSEAQNIKLYGFENTLRTGSGNDTIVVDGYVQKIYGGDGDDNITCYSRQSYVYGEAGNDTLTANTNAGLYGGDGDDTLINNASNPDGLHGEAGNDTYEINYPTISFDTSGNNIYHINTDRADVKGSSGNDTFYVKGNNNIVQGSEGNNYFIITGNNNNIDGGIGSSSYTDSGSGNIYTNISEDLSSNTLIFTYLGEVKTFNLGGKIYTVTNNLNGTNSLKYSQNTNTGAIILNGSSLTVDGVADSSNILEIYGSNNTINGGNQADKITVQSGTGNTINGGSGDDTLVSNTENNSLIGGNGNDTLTLNASSNLEINGGDGNDIINVNSSNNTNIKAGAGNDVIKVTGNTNTIDAGDGNNSLEILTSSNTITAGNGDNTLVINGSDNTLSAGSGNNKLSVSGSNNDVNVQKVSGRQVIYGDNNTINETEVSGEVKIIGNGNSYTTVEGSNSLNVTGNTNSIQTGNGADTITINGDNNIAKGGAGNDRFKVNGTGNIVDGEDGNRNLLDDNGVNTIYYNICKIISQPFELNLKVDIGCGDDKFISCKLDLESFDLMLDFSTPIKAKEGLELIDNILNKVSAQLVNIGSVLNRLDSVLEEQNIKLENMISTRSTIRDADISKVTSDYIRYQILQDATATLMSSSRNIRAENVLGLLQNLNSAL